MFNCKMLNILNKLEKNIIIINVKYNIYNLCYIILFIKNVKLGLFLIMGIKII